MLNVISSIVKKNTALALTFSLGLINASNTIANDDPVLNAYHEKHKTNKAPFANKKERAIALALFQYYSVYPRQHDDILELMKGDGVVTDGYSYYTDYNKSQALGDQKYVNKTVYLSGTLQQTINMKSASERMIIMGSNSYGEIVARIGMDEYNTRYLSILEPGNPIDLRCIGNGMLQGVPSLDRCTATGNFVSSVFMPLIGNVDKEYSVEWVLANASWPEVSGETTLNSTIARFLMQAKILNKRGIDCNINTFECKAVLTNAKYSPKDIMSFYNAELKS